MIIDDIKIFLILYTVIIIGMTVPLEITSFVNMLLRSVEVLRSAF